MRSVRTHELTRLRRLRRMIVGGFVTYGVLAALALGEPGYEIFPFFCWFLFPVTPNHVERFSVELIRVGEQTFEPPLPFERAARWVESGSVDARFLIQRLGRALQEHDQAGTTVARALLEKRFLPHGCRYRVLGLRHDALQPFRDPGAPLAASILAGSLRTADEAPHVHSAAAEAR